MRNQVEIGRIELSTGQGLLYILDGVAPRIAPDAFITPTAVVIGDVEIGPQSDIWFFCVLRGEEGGVLGAGALLPTGKVIDHNELWVGVPARFKRIMSTDERAGFDRDFRAYVQNAARFRAGLRPII